MSFVIADFDVVLGDLMILLGIPIPIRSVRSVLDLYWQKYWYHPLQRDSFLLSCCTPLENSKRNASQLSKATTKWPLL